MDRENLIRMANRIGDFFEAYPDREEALEGIAIHIRKFWEPRMRRDLLQVLETTPTGLTPIVLQAMQTHRGVVQ